MSSLEFRQNYVVNFSHIDNRGISRPSAIADFMQDAATFHANETGLSRTALSSESNAVWLLCRLKYYLKRPLYPYETVTIATWHRGMHGALWYRDFSFSAGDKNIGNAVTAWALVNIDTRRLIRPTSFLNADLYVDPSRNQGEVLDKLYYDTLTKISEHEVKYSDIDINNHLNNVKIIDILSDALEINKKDNQFVSTLQVNYISETPFGTKLEIFNGQDGNNNIYLSAHDDSKTKFEANVNFSKIP